MSADNSGISSDITSWCSCYCEDVTRCEILNGIHLCGVPGSYGGGDAMKMCRVLFAKNLTPKCTSDFIEVNGEKKPCKCGSSIFPHFPEFRQKIRQCMDNVVAQLREIPQDKQVVSLPAPIPKWEDIDWEVSIVTAQMLAPGTVDHYNMFFQGSLFAQDVEHDPTRLGISSWPLIGIFNAKGISVNAMEMAAAGLESLAAADQHVHVVQEVIELDGFPMEFKDWHFGFTVDESLHENKAVIACLDLETTSCYVILLLLLSNAECQKFEKLSESDKLKKFTEF